MTKLDQAQKTAQKIGLGVVVLMILFFIGLGFIYNKFSRTHSQTLSEKSPASQSGENAEASQEESQWLEVERQKLAQFLKDQGAVLYYGTSCPHCHKQLELFGQAADLLKKIDCYLEENAEICNKENISGVPTWKYKGEEKVGVQTLDELAEWVGYKK